MSSPSDNNTPMAPNANPAPVPQDSIAEETPTTLTKELPNPFTQDKTSTLDAGYEPSLQEDDEDEYEEMVDVVAEEDDEDYQVSPAPRKATRRVQRKRGTPARVATEDMEVDSPADGTPTTSSASKRSSITKRFKAEVSTSNILPPSASRRSRKPVDYNKIHYEEPLEESTPKRRNTRNSRQLTLSNIMPRRTRKSVDYQEPDDIPEYEDEMSDEEEESEADENESASDVEFVDVSPPKRTVRKTRKPRAKVIDVDEEEEDEEVDQAADDNEESEEEDIELVSGTAFVDDGDVIDNVEIILAVRSPPKEDEEGESSTTTTTTAAAPPSKEDDDAGDIEDDDESNYQYFVKFQNRSYRWATWVGRDQIEEQRNGATKIERFHRKHGYPEDFENLDGVYFNPSYTDVDRVIGEATQGGKKIFLVKWKALGYDQCTWEFEDTLDKEKWAIEDFRKRNTMPSYADLRNPPRPSASEFEKVTNEDMQFKDGNELRSYQIEGVNWMIFSWFNRVNGILADEMGLGKTIQTVSMIYYLFKQQHNRGPFLIIAPLSTIEHWKREIEEWTDMNCVVFHGNKTARRTMYDYEFYYSKKGRPITSAFKFNVMITTYEMCLQEKSTLARIKWQYLAVDEGHRLKNKSSKLLDVLQHFSVEHKLLLTGTPIQNDIGELFTLLNYLNPARFPSRSDFDAKYGNLQNKEQVEELHNLIKPYLLRRMKEDVEKSIPPKEEIVVEVVPTTYQKTYYKALLEGKREFLRQGLKKKSQMPRLVNILMEIRKVCNHPFLIAGAESQITMGMTPTQINETLIRSSSKLIFTDKLLKHLKANGNKVLIFSQMVRVLHILEDFLHYRGYNYVRLDGSIKGDVRQEAIDRFNDPSQDVFAFLISTRAGGVGINLMAADTVIIFDSDFNPQNDIQAQARCHRIGQQKEVKVYRLLTKDTKEFDLFQKANRKLGLDRAVLSNISSVDFSGKKTQSSIGLDKDEIDILLKHGAYVAYKDDTEEEKMLLEGDIDDILKRSSKVVRWDQETAKKEKGGVSHFSKASFNFEGESVDIDDKDFWTKVLPQAKDVHGLEVLFKTEGALSTEEDRQQFFRDLKVLVDTALDQMSKFERSPDHDKIGDLLTRIRFSLKVNPEQREMATEWLEKLNKRLMRQGSRRGADLDRMEIMNDDDDEGFIPMGTMSTTHTKKGGWYKTERDGLFRVLNHLGWGKWEVFKERKCPNKSTFEIRSMTEAIVQVLIDACRNQDNIDRIGEKDSKDSKNADDKGAVKRRNYNQDIVMLRSLLQSSGVEADSIDEQNKQHLLTKVKRQQGESILPGKGVFVIFPEDKKVLDGPCRVEIIEQSSSDPTNEITPSKNMCVRMIELTDEDKSEDAFKVSAPGYRCQFRVRLISPQYTGESDEYIVRGVHPQCEDPEFRSKLYKNHKSYIKKLRNANNLTKLLTHFQHKPKATDIPDVAMKVPAPWWDKQCDADMLVGIASHGLGKFQDLKIDQTLCYQQKMKNYAEGLNTRREKDNVEKSFPSSTNLSKRMDRIVDTMLKDVGLWESHDSAGTVTTSREWGKSERERFKRDMNIFGGHPNKDGEMNYGTLIASAKLSKSPQYMKVYVKAFLKMCARVCEMELTDEEKIEENDEFKTIEKDVEELGQKSAKKILERVRLMRGLAMYVFEEAEENASKFNRHTKKKGSGLPNFWNVTTHDVDLIKGVQKYGVDSKAILADKDLSFSKLTDDQRKKIRDALFVKRLDDFQRFMEKLHKCGSPKQSKTLWDFTPKKQSTVLDKAPHVTTNQDGTKAPKSKKQTTLTFGGGKKRKRISLDTANGSTTTSAAAGESSQERKIKRVKKNEGEEGATSPTPGSPAAPAPTSESASTAVSAPSGAESSESSTTTTTSAAPPSAQ